MKTSLLSAGSTRALNRALDRLIVTEVSSVEEEEALKLISLLSHSNSEIRHQAALLLGMRLQERRALQSLVRAAQSRDEDPDVVTIAIWGIVQISERHPDIKTESLGALATIALDEDRTAEDRGLAYLAARTAAGLASAQEVAHAPWDIRLVKVDCEWLRSLIIPPSD